MTAPDMVDKLAALEEARSRLEQSLRGDENWRALRQAPQRVGRGDWSPARRARDRRLEMALAANPLYHAWKHVTEAISLLRESPRAERDLAEVREPPDAPLGASETGVPHIEALIDAYPNQPAEAEQADVADPADDLDTMPAGGERAARRRHELDAGDDLPDEILRLLRAADSPATLAQSPAPAPRLVVPEVGALASQTRQPAGLDDETSAAADVAAPVAEPPDDPLPAHVEAAERMDRLEAELREITDPLADADDEEPSTPASAHVTSGALAAPPAASIEAAIREEGAGDAGPAGEPPPAFREVPDVDEAKVTFVTREPRALLPAADLPADLGTQRKSPLFERLRKLDEDPVDGETTEPFAAPNGFAEEAEVTIIKRGGEKRGGERPPPAGQGRGMRRFLKALQGD